MTPARTRGQPLASAAFAAAVLVNFFVLYWPRHVSQGGIPYLDKVVHLVIFAAVAASGVRVFVRSTWVVGLVGLLVAQAVISELVQHWFLANRSGDLTDVVADLVGVGLGVVLGFRLVAATGDETSTSVDH